MLWGRPLPKGLLGTRQEISVY